MSGVECLLGAAVKPTLTFDRIPGSAQIAKPFLLPLLSLF